MILAAGDLGRGGMHVRVIGAALDRLGGGLLGLLEPPRRQQEVDAAAQRPRIAGVDRQRALNPADRLIVVILIAGDPGRGGMHVRVVGAALDRLGGGFFGFAKAPRPPQEVHAAAQRLRIAGVDRERVLNPADRLIVPVLIAGDPGVLDIQSGTARKTASRSCCGLLGFAKPPQLT